MTGVQVLKLKLDDLVLDPKFQRPLNERFVDKIVDNYDEKLLGVLVCNKRYNGTYSVTDGHHRLQALKKLGRKQATCVVFEIDVMDEGKLFVALQKERRPVTAIEQHHVLVNSKDELAVKIDRITNRNGFKIASDSIGCIQRIRFMAEHRDWKLSDYDDALEIIAAVWGTDSLEARKLAMVMGMWMFLYRSDLRVTQEGAMDAFMPLDVRGIMRDAKLVDMDHSDMGSMGAVAWVLSQAYNKHHRLRGTQKIERRIFTNSFRTSLGMQRRKANAPVDTGSSTQNEFRSPLSNGTED